MSKSKLNIIISLVIGISIFLFFVWYVGPDALRQVYHNIQPIYFIPYVVITTLLFFTQAWRLHIVLKAYKKSVGFWTLMRQNIAGFALSYVTPAVRIGGEPLKVYMLKKESKVNIRTGTSAVIMDKFIEFTGTLIYGIISLTLLMFLDVPNFVRVMLGLALLAGFLVLSSVYYWTLKKGPGPFTNLFELLKFYRFPKFRKIKGAVVHVEKNMELFFRKHKKEFFLGCFTYLVYGVLTVFEAKCLLLAIGIETTLVEIMIIVVIWGAINFIPVPAGLGFHEASQTGLFALLKGAGALGFAFALITRVRQIFFTALGFAFTSHFGAQQIRKKIESKKLKLKL